jgi:putative sterol carrier protein
MAAREFFAELAEKAEPSRLEGVDSSYLFDVTGEGRWLVEVRDQKVTVTQNPAGEGDVTFTLSGETFDRLLSRQQNPMIAYMTGKLKISGDLNTAMELQKLIPD